MTAYPVCMANLTKPKRFFNIIVYLPGRVRSASCVPPTATATIYEV